MSIQLSAELSPMHFDTFLSLSFVLDVWSLALVECPDAPSSSGLFQTSCQNFGDLSLN